jgi:hypothetical protein
MDFEVKEFFMVIEKCVFCNRDTDCWKDPGDIWKMACVDCGDYKITFDAVDIARQIFNSGNGNLKKVRDWLVAHPGVEVTTKNINFIF